MFHNEYFIVCCFTGQTLYWEKSCSWDIGKSSVNQLDCRIFKSTIFSEQIDKIIFFACCYKFTKIKSPSKSFCLGMVINVCGQSGLWTLRWTVSQEWADEINWSFWMMVQIHAIKRWLKSLGWNGQKWVWLVWWRDPKIDCIWRMNRGNNWSFAQS